MRRNRVEPSSRAGLRRGPAGSLLRSRAGGLFAALVVVLAVGTAAGLILLWRGAESEVNLDSLVADSELGEVRGIESFACSAFRPTRVAASRWRC